MTDTSIMRLNDRLAIQELAQAYAHFVDRRDFDSLVLLFTPDAVLAGYDGDPIDKEPRYQRRGRDEIRTAMEGLLRYDATHHMLGQNMIAFDEGSSLHARGELYCNAQHKYTLPSGEWNRTMLIRYLDLYERVDDVWHIADRKLAVEWTDVQKISVEDH